MVDTDLEVEVKVVVTGIEVIGHMEMIPGIIITVTEGVGVVAGSEVKVISGDKMSETQSTKGKAGLTAIKVRFQYTGIMLM